MLSRFLTFHGQGTRLHRDHARMPVSEAALKMKDLRGDYEHAQK
jgi:hypothetical protein